MYGSIINYGQHRYLKQAAALVFIALLLFLSATPGERPNGGTWQGYTLGVISAALILSLLWFGIRKRQYHCTETSLVRWASAHVYLGISLPVVVSLHCGLQFGWNVHTLAYALMVLVVLSGFYGLYTYLVFPAAVTANRNGISRKEMITALAQLDETCLILAEELSAEAHQYVLQEVVETRLGGTLWQQITKSVHLSISISPLLLQKLAGSFVRSEPDRLEMLMPSRGDFPSNSLLKSQNKEVIHRVAELLNLLNKRQSLVGRVQRDIRYHAFMKYWLLLHIPLACALFAAVMIHVIIVFFYW